MCMIIPDAIPTRPFPAGPRLLPITNHQSRFDRLYRSHVELVFAAAAVAVIVRERVAHGGERELVPRHFVLGVQPRLESLGAGVKVEIEQPRAEQDVYLADVRDVVERVERTDFHPCVGLLQSLAQRALTCGFAVFHVAGGPRPQPVTRLDRAAAQQDPVLPFHDATDHHPRVLVVDGVASAAYEARQRVAFGYAQCDLRAALAAEFHNAHYTVTGGRWKSGAGVGPAIAVVSVP